MSMQARIKLVHRLVFQDEVADTDLLNPLKTDTSLIALLLDVTKIHRLEITAVRSDHRDDGGGHSHSNGYAADCWPIYHDAGSYYPAEGISMDDFLSVCRRSIWLYQIGLGGEAFTNRNLMAAGPTAFEDNGQDHIHLGSEEK